MGPGLRAGSAHALWPISNNACKRGGREAAGREEGGVLPTSGGIQIWQTGRGTALTAPGGSRWGTPTQLQEGHVPGGLPASNCLCLAPCVLCVGSEAGVRGELDGLRVRCLQDRPYICNMAVAPAFRGQGHGKRIMSAAEELVAVMGESEIYLHVRWDHQKRGNKKGGKRKEKTHPLFWPLGRLGGGCTTPPASASH